MTTPIRIGSTFVEGFDGGYLVTLDDGSQRAVPNRGQKNAAEIVTDAKRTK